jgi:hypothetical protein
MNKHEIISKIHDLLSKLSEDQPQEIEWKEGYPFITGLGICGTAPANYSDKMPVNAIIDTTTPSTLRWIPHLTRSMPSELKKNTPIIAFVANTEIISANAKEFYWEDTSEESSVAVVAYCIIANPVPQWLSADAERKEAGK